MSTPGRDRTNRPLSRRCVNCSLRLAPNLRRRPIEDLDEQMLILLRSWVSPTPVSSEDILCLECFLLLQERILSNTTPSQIEVSPPLGHLNICFGCGISIASRRTHRVSQDCPQRTFILRWTPAHHSFAESCADAGDSGPVEKQKFDETDICDDDDDDSDTLVESNVCRVCLALDVKMYDLKDIELREMFQNITGIVVTENDHSLLERLCWECAGRLKAAAVFRKKALLSDALLQGLANTGEQIRKKDVTLIKENQDYLKSAGTLSIVEVFHTVQIDAEYESAPCVSKNNDTDIVQNIDRKDTIELTESVFKENNCQMDVENESMIEAPIKTEIEYDPICPNTCEENRNILLDTNPLFSNNIPLREDTSNSAYRSPPPGCSQVIPSDCEKKIKKTIIKIVNRDSISKIESKKSKEVINHDTLKGGAKLKNINLKLGGISKKTSNKKLVKKTQVTANTDEEYLGLESFEF